MIPSAKNESTVPVRPLRCMDRAFNRNSMSYAFSPRTLLVTA
jgi:hypothetical protein